MLSPSKLTSAEGVALLSVEDFSVLFIELKEVPPSFKKNLLRPKITAEDTTIEISILNPKGIIEAQRKKGQASVVPHQKQDGHCYYNKYKNKVIVNSNK